MSRRKQSNPKPLKRKSDDVLEAVAEIHHLPTDLLTLKDPEDEAQEYTVFTKERLREGFLFGPYAGHLLGSTPGRQSPLYVLQTHDAKGKSVRLGLTDDSGGWLKLLRPASSHNNANITVSLDGSDIWCTVTNAIEADTELLMTCQILEEDEEATRPSRSPTGLDSPVRNSNHLLQRSDNLLVIKDPERWRHRPPSCRKRKLRASAEVNDSEIDQEIHDAKENKSGSPDCNEAMSQHEILSDSCTRYEASSLSSPPCATSPPPELHPISASRATTASGSAAYINGYRTSSAFPYGSTAECITDGPFQCSTCSIKFSNPRTLQVHQLYYCSQRLSSLAANSDTDTEETSSTMKTEPTSNSLTPANAESDDGSTKHPKSNSKRFADPMTICHYEMNSSSSRRSSLPSGIGQTNSKISRVYKCPYCRYSSDKKASLTRHVRMHGNPSSSSDQQNDMPICTPPLARYCANCDIQFASFKNYQVHKQFYCSTRHVHKSAVSTSSSSPSQQGTSGQRASPEKPTVTNSQEGTSYPHNMMMDQPLYAAISTSPLILVPCSYVAGGGLSPAAGLIPAGNIIIPNNTVSSPESESSSQTPNVIPTYTVMPGTTVSTICDEDTTKSHLPETTERCRSSSEKREGNTEEKIQSPVSKSVDKDDSEKPLDLSFRKGSDGKEIKSPPQASSNVSAPISVSSTSSCPEDAPPTQFPLGHCAPHPLDVALMSRNLQTPTGTSSSAVLDPRNSAVTPVPVPTVPQVLVKQGTSKCKECNIVFYKHENYMVHKSLYCASRLQSTQRVSPDTGKIDEEMAEIEASGTQDATRSSSPIVSFPKTPEPTDTPTERSPTNQSLVLQFYCMACGIKFTSIDNLTAHQTYYCPKRELVANQPVGVVPVSRGDFRCTKCKNTYPTEESLRHHPCPVQRKCPYCDVYCPTLSATQRHLVTHTGVKSFRCSLCGYKGHTLRGMRTHIRIHLDKNNTTPEEAYILCVDEGGSEIGSINRKHNRSSTERTASSLPDPAYNESIVVSLSNSGTPALVPTDMPARKALPDIVSDQVVSGDITHWCQICGYSSSYKGNVVRHVKLVHKELMATQSMASIVNSRPSVPVSECKPTDNIDSPTEEKVRSDKIDSTNTKSIVNGNATKPETHQKGKTDDSTPVIVKSESLSPPPVSGTGRGAKRSLSVEGQSTSALVSPSSKTGPKYCKSCDISFNYLSNFIAHKKFYCTPRPGEVSAQESGPVQSVQ